jgi:hypothetical protein
VQADRGVGDESLHPCLSTQNLTRYWNRSVVVALLDIRHAASLPRRGRAGVTTFPTTILTGSCVFRDSHSADTRHRRLAREISNFADAGERRERDDG